MGDLADIIKETHEIFKGSTALTVSSSGLGMAYAIPQGSEDTVVDTFGPWKKAEQRQVFFRETLLGAVAAEIQFILSWKCSAAEQYIFGVEIIPKKLSLDPTVDLDIQVKFHHPEPYDFELEAYEIPFTITVEYNPIGGDETVIYRGTVRANGTGEFPPEE
ncbi:hypothetical protein [Streptomyces sp. NPDC089795]|uniref:hypothetical protein n=1 Tax=Streptomyces sp. NPDC089795 TaxID=3155297 RepID=UPI003449AA9C